MPQTMQVSRAPFMSPACRKKPLPHVVWRPTPLRVVNLSPIVRPSSRSKNWVVPAAPKPSMVPPPSSPPPPAISDLAEIAIAAITALKPTSPPPPPAPIIKPVATPVNRLPPGDYSLTLARISFRSMHGPHLPPASPPTISKTIKAPDYDAEDDAEVYETPKETKEAKETKKDEEVYEIEKILRTSYTDDGVKLYRVQWKGYSSKHNMWIPIECFTDPDIAHEYDDAEAERKKRRQQRMRQRAKKRVYRDI